MAEGLQIALEKHPDGLTVDLNGRPLLEFPFILQCPPLEEHKVSHAFNMGTYDTVLNGQFARWGSLQLATWQFDTLVMYIAVAGPSASHPGGQVLPSFVAFPTAAFYTPDWYVDQIEKIHNAGAPFLYTAQLAGVDMGPSWRSYATLAGFSETLKHGEGDCIYLEGVSFQEWRDPTLRRRGARRRGGRTVIQPGGVRR